MSEGSDSAASAAEYPPELSRLPPGRHGLPREFVVNNQRGRLISAAATAISQNGYAATTIADITRAAAVSRRTFYEHFSSKGDCFVVAYDTAWEALGRRMNAAFQRQEEWPQAVRAGLAAMLEFLGEEPDLARLVMVEGLVGGIAFTERYGTAVRILVPYLAAGRERSSQGPSADLAPATEEAVIGGMVSLVSRRIWAGRHEELPALLPDLVEFALTPYLGSAEARQVAREDGR